MIYVATAIICALVGYAIGQPKGRAALGLVLGLFFNVVGLIIIAVLGESPERLIARQRQGATSDAGPSSQDTAASPKVLSVRERLDRLNELHDDGTLSDIEWQTQRDNILAQL